MDRRQEHGSFDYLTDSLGRPIPNDNNSLTVGSNGPTLLEDITQIDKISHFDRERIPERVVHAKGAGAFGYFQNYRCMKDYTMADLFQSPNQKTKVFVRFSTVIGSKGSADTARDPRGFAVKFYTNQGIYDIVGNDIPVFFIRDAIRFPDVIHSLKPSPDTNIRDPQRFWDFISLSPEATHMITWVYSDRGTIKDYRNVDGFGVNTYVWVNQQGKRHLIKYHWKTQQGIETIDRFEAEKLAGSNPDIAVENLYQAIECGNYPRWELCIQIMDPDNVECLDFDPLDDTKTWPEDVFPLIPIGMMTLNENPSNFFAQVEQSAFCPANLVPGVELSADKMLQGRSFSYHDTQRYRLGTNFSQLPINRSISPVDNNQRDGEGTYLFNPEPINYSPNSLNNNKPLPYPIPVPAPKEVCGFVVRIPIENANDFKQAGEHYDTFNETEKNHLVDNIAVELYKCRDDIVNRVLNYFMNASKDFGYRVLTAVKEYRQKDNC
ncbi:catalase [Anaerosporobacter faecicola]|uniref:catalase n=1 Tax=Anaerosporobacter faecicola TaxID=2718714 RepID=UPI00143CB050|nr:catalase [Anaerosporobacter faecicola]